MLTHYVIVRRDLPVGVITAMVTHASGESSVLYQPKFEGCVAVVLEAKDEQELKDTATYLQACGVDFVPIRENSGVYTNQLMALGLVPRERDEIAPLLLGYQTLKYSTYSDPGDECTCSNCRLDKPRKTP